MKQNISAQSLYFLLKEIPKGKITTYKGIASALKTKAYRQIGQILRKNTSPETFPCYKVISSNGKISGYYGSSPKNTKKKIALLRKEGIIVKNNKINLKKYLYTFKAQHQ